jgi:nitronate monooxygenase
MHPWEEWNATGFARRVGIEHPIVQGPFGGGFSSPRLVAAVSNAGGLGSFGANSQAPDELAGIVDSVRVLTGKPFAVNLWVSTHDEAVAGLTRGAYEKALAGVRRYFDEFGVEPPEFPYHVRYTFDEQIRALLDAAPPVFSFIFGIPPRDILDECRRKGIATVGTATTAEEAKALDAAGVDAIVASGFEAGGHRASFLKPAEESLTGTFSLVPQVVDAVKAPVVAAGGIADARGIVAALALGAQGVQIGTAFLACDESNATDMHKAMLFGEAGRHTALTRNFTGRLARSIRSRFVAETSHPDFTVLPYPVQGWLLKPLVQAAIAQRRADVIPLWAGQGAHMVRYTKASDLMAALVADTRALLAGPRH